MAREFRLPDLGEGIAEGQIVRVMVKEGDTIAEDQPIMEVETDKAAVEIPSPIAGVAAKVHVKEGQTVAVGAVLVTFDGGSESQPAAKATGTRKAEAAAASSSLSSSGGGTATAAPPRQTYTPPSSPARTRAAAAPAIRKFARESGVDIDSLVGSGPGGRVLREDVEQAAGGAQPAVREPAATRTVQHTRPAPAMGPVQVEGVAGMDKWGPIKRQRLSQIRKTIANQMVRSVSEIPHVTQTDEADITELEIIRHNLRGEDGEGIRVTTMAFLLRTLAVCLRQHPNFNASFDAENEEIVFKEYINIGVAVDSPRGLVVPAIRNVDQLSVMAISQELRLLADKVRNSQFTVDELRGGTFTVTNYGAVGGIWGTPIINHPEVAILGVGRSQQRVVLEDDELETRVYLPLSLSFDHRAVDGAQAARFLNDVIAHLSNPGLLLVK